MPQRGEIVLVPVPFTDLSSNRRRPVIVISNDDYQKTTQDMIVIAMTSNPANVPYSFVLDTPDLEKGALNRPGKVRVDKVYTLSQRLVTATFGKVKEDVLDRIRKELDELTKKT
jgi:mRNA interferase MazF